MNRGKAEADGHDQRGTVRVIPKPSTGLPERFPSVVQDWEGAIQDARRRKSTKAITRFSPIREDDELPSGWKPSPIPHEFDITGKPDNADPPASSRVATANKPPSPGVGSEELGDSPSPAARETIPHSSFKPINGNGQQSSASVTEPGIFSTGGITTSHKRKRTPVQDSDQARSRSHTSERMATTSPSAMHKPRSPSLNIENASRKRKQTPEPDRPTKQPRIETNGSLQISPTPTSTSPARRRVPTFSSPRRRVSISEESRHTSETGLGLGITRSPQSNRKQTDNLKTSQGPIKRPLFPSSAPTSSPWKPEKPRLPSSALKKDHKSALPKPQKRHSVSFVDSEDGDHNVAPKQSQQAPTSSQMSDFNWPPGFSQEQIEEFQRKADRMFAEGEQQPDKGKEKQTKTKQAKETQTREEQAKEKRQKQDKQKQEEGKSNPIDEPYDKPRTSRDTSGTPGEPEIPDSRQAILGRIASIEKQLHNSRTSKRDRGRLKKRLDIANRQLHEEEAKSSQLEPPLPVVDTTVARQIPENEDRAASNTSDPSLDGGTGTRRQSVSSTSTHQSESPLAHELSKSPNKPRKEPADTAPASTHAPTSLDRSQSRSASLSHSVKSNDAQEKQATPWSPSVKEEEDSGTEESFSSEEFNEPAMDLDTVEEQSGAAEEVMDLDNIEEQNGEDDEVMEMDNVEEDQSDDEDRSSQTNSSSDSDEAESDDEDGQSEINDDDDGQHELKAQDAHLGGNQNETYSPNLETDTHLGDSEVSAGPEDGQDGGQETDGHAEDMTVNHDQKQADFHIPEAIEVSSGSGDSSEFEHDEDLEENMDGEIQEHAVRGEQDNPNAPIPESVNAPLQLRAVDSPENSQNDHEDIGTGQNHSGREHLNQVNGHASALGDTSDFQLQANDQTPVNGDTPARPNETTDDSSEESDEDSDESDSLALPKKLSAKPQTSVGSASSMPAKPHPPTSTGMPVLQRTTLKGLLKAQKEESQRREQQHYEPRPQRPSGGSREDVWDVPSSRESKTSSDTESEGGDIPHGGGGGGLFNTIRRTWNRS